VKYIDFDPPTIEVTIKNQPFTAYQVNGYVINGFYFNMRTKGHDQENWTNTFRVADGFPTQATNDDTTLVFTSVGKGFFNFASPYYAQIYAPYGQKIDFQVQAMIGYASRNASTFWAPWCFYGNTSDWSPTQTLLIGNPPNILLLSPQAANYTVPDVALNVTIDGLISQTAYSLDGQENVTTRENATSTLTNLSNGVHNVTVYATDLHGYIWASNTTFFNVDVIKPTPQPFPTNLVLASIVIIVVIVAGLLVYFKKRKH
jgi:hypothetical protein